MGAGVRADVDGVVGARADVEAEAKEQVGGGEVDSGAVMQSMVVSLVGNSAEVVGTDDAGDCHVHTHGRWQCPTRWIDRA